MNCDVRVAVHVVGILNSLLSPVTTGTKDHGKTSINLSPFWFLGLSH